MVEIITDKFTPDSTVRVDTDVLTHLLAIREADLRQAIQKATPKAKQFLKANAQL